MDINQILTTVFQIVGIPILGALTTIAVKWINAKAKELLAKTDNIYAQKYITMLNDSITSAVIAVNQTYVEALKEQGSFDEEAQKKAFDKVYNMVMNSLTAEATKYVNEVVGDVKTYVTNKIEENVVALKTN